MDEASFLRWVDHIIATTPDPEVLESEPLFVDPQILIEEEHADALAHYYESLTWNL